MRRGVEIMMIPEGCIESLVTPNPQSLIPSHSFLLSHIHRLSVCKEDFSATLSMTIRESDVFKPLSHPVT